MEFLSFDASYLERLAAGDPETERHFSEYFSELILIKLRAREYARGVIDEIRQETFLRVLQAIRRQGIPEPEHIGSFVNEICNAVELKFGPSGSRFADALPDSGQDLITRKEAALEVRSILSKMPPQKRQVLSTVFMEGRPYEDVYMQFEESAQLRKVVGQRRRRVVEQKRAERPKPKALHAVDNKTPRFEMERSASRSAQQSGSQPREAVIARAIEIIGDEQEALRWLGTPVRALDYATPISRLNDPEGQTAVLNVLVQLEHGVL